MELFASLHAWDEQYQFHIGKSTGLRFQPVSPRHFMRAKKTRQPPPFFTTRQFPTSTYIYRYLIQPMDPLKMHLRPICRHRHVQLRDKIQPPPAQHFTASTPINEFHVLFHDKLLCYHHIHPYDGSKA